MLDWRAVVPSTGNPLSGKRKVSTKMGSLLHPGDVGTKPFALVISGHKKPLFRERHARTYRVDER